MKKILKYTAILSVLASVVTTGCIKETFPTGSSISADQATASADALKSMTAAIHNYAANAEWANSSVHSFYGLPSIGVHRDVMCNDLTIMDNPYGWYSQFQSNQGLSSTSSHIQIFWLIYTKIIALSNDVIRMNPDLDAIVDTNKGYVGAAYAYRALAMLEMAQMHEFKANKYTSKEGIEGLTVPYLHENMTVDYAKNNPRLTKAEAIEKIYELLDKAILLLDGHSPSTDKTLPDLAVAYGLYARTKLYEGDYANAKVYAEKALAAGSFSPLTKEQWTSVQNGFNNADSQSSWMLCIRTSSESTVVKRGIVNFTSFMSNENTYGYGGPGAGAYVMVDKQFYNQISNADFRKLSWKAPAGHVLEAENLFVPATDSYPGAEALPEYGALKFRPGEANPDDYLVGSAVDIPLMRMEEMKFIIAECDARLNNDAAALVDIVKTRNAEYACSLTGEDLLREVFFQKRVEFWGEGIVFFDYKRCPEILQINRGYKGTNHPELCRFNCDGLAPWFNFPINGYEAQDNKALSETNNPDPSNTIQPWVE
jgi:tetratricopeptide (TPR) repeat protein